MYRCKIIVYKITRANKMHGNFAANFKIKFYVYLEYKTHCLV